MKTVLVRISKANEGHFIVSPSSFQMDKEIICKDKEEMLQAINSYVKGQFVD